MKQTLREKIQTTRLYFDGGTGTVLQGMGLPAGTPPELWNLTNPQAVENLHRAYLDAGANIIKTNTFGVNREKYENYAALISAAFSCAKNAVQSRDNAYIAFDMGPTGHLLEPLGDLKFEDAVDLFAANVKAAAELGADCILIETMNDSLETKAAVLAAKENSDLPIFVTNAYGENDLLMTGASPEAMVAMLEGLGVTAVGLNCSFGPDKMQSVVRRLALAASVPLIVNPNAGLPAVQDGKTVYSIGVEEFADYMADIANEGGCILGGCCGTTPDYIKAMIQAVEAIPYTLPEKKHRTQVSSYGKVQIFGKNPVLIGERINPTGKKKLKEALRSGNQSYLLREGIRQAEKGVHILDVNVGLPELNEPEVLYQTVKALQAVTDLPLQLDSSDPKALERAMRIYNGKPLINSVSGTMESKKAVFPLVRHYGGCLIALTMDENGIPETAEGRVAIAQSIIEEAKEYGIAQKDIIVDPLCMTVSSGKDNGKVTLEAVRMLHNLGIRTSLGVSNVSFGLPKRGKLNAAFFTAALVNGLSCAIMNPFAEEMMDAYFAYRALLGLDEACGDYIAYASEAEEEAPTAPVQELSLKQAIVRGLGDASLTEAKELLKSHEPLKVIQEHIVPALNEVGIAFEQQKVYLPQLLMSAEAASAAFECVKEKLPAAKADGQKAMVLATVQGDIHDIGKNIVRVLLQSYGFMVYDLGRDVPPEKVCRAATEKGCRLVGLSALMTTTVPAMEETIQQLHQTDENIKVVVGGAVLTADYAEAIGADCYAKDAMDTVRYAQKFYKG